MWADFIENVTHFAKKKINPVLSLQKHWLRDENY